MADRGRGAARGGRGGPIKRTMGGPSSAVAQAADKPRREAILDLSKYVDERIRVKFTGGREVTGVLKGYDQLLNLVLDDVTEEMQLPEPHTRTLGLTVLRGPTITVLNPVDGSEEIANPFLAAEQ
ncbi:U6 snRNA-associated Sm-like protein LSm7 [Psilocybe cubensis]|uniref:U6 snRNA-associated Sm-like protein LSm7 n=1 Tax=Psilocybe cubensis TaxID=181762 RepID=A0ACB8GN33_PSICU|nr:U6 snRNA-associated Sm-like protein LSm7 [Psilocybe cubensis]KAH9476953.1 U6 snRNA-associated Sm-like protein LSm7 [Psilocybe cubensis]